MTIDQVIKLLDAGYTRDDIAAFGATGDAKTETPDEKPAEDQKENNESDAGAAAIESLTAAVNELKQTVAGMQAANVQGANQEPKKARTAEDVIKDFISKS